MLLFTLLLSFIAFKNNLEKRLVFSLEIYKLTYVNYVKF